MNNNINNLRWATHQENNMNKSVNYNSKSGAKGIIYNVALYYGLYEFYCAPVEKLTFIGIGGYNFEHHYYMKTFTNVTEIIGHTIRALHVSEDYQHFITIHNEITNICNFYTT